MHTPDEAKDIRCCGPEDCGETRRHEGHAGEQNYRRFCLAAGCSAWRWAETFSVTDRHDAEIAEKFMGKGFCGLAGRP